MGVIEKKHVYMEDRPLTSGGKKSSMWSNSSEGIVRRFLERVDIEDVDKMSHEQKLYYISRMQKVIDSFEKNKLEYYNKGKRIHNKQLKFHKSPRRKRGLLGGNRTGKTVAGAVEAVWYARGNHPFKRITKSTNGWVVSLTNEVQRDVAQKEVLKWINPDWIIDYKVRDGSKSDRDNAVLDYIVIENVLGGQSIIGFKTVEQGRERFQGTSKDWIWFDEEPPKDIYDECLMRIMDTEGDIWFTMTPLKGLTFIYDMIYLNERNDPEVWCQTMAWEDNPFLSRKEIELMESTLTEEEREARQYGRFVALTGLIYRKFDTDIHVLDAEYDSSTRSLYLIDEDGNRFSKIYKQWYQKFSIDDGYTNPTSVHFYAQDDEGCVYVLAEHYQAYMLAEDHAKEVKRIAKMLDWPKTNGGYLGIMDTSANKKTTANEVSTKERYAIEGIYTENAKKDVYEGIQMCIKYIEPRPYFDAVSWPKGKPKLFVLNVLNWPYNNTAFMREMKKYRWKEGNTKENATEGPTKKDDHAMDDFRYFINSLLPLKEGFRHRRIKPGRNGFLSETEKQDLGIVNQKSATRPFRPGRIKS